MDERANHLYRFGSFLLDAGERRLLRNGKPVPLTQKALEILLLLVRNNGRLVEKGEMLRAIWPEVFVEEANLAQNVFRLRKVLGEGQNGKCPYIETVPRCGYRFVAAVRQLPNGGRTSPRSRRTPQASHAAQAKPRVPARSLNSLAVLPLANAGSDARMEYLCDGITESLINCLLQLPQLHVVARNTAFHYKNREIDPRVVGRELNVRAVLTGRVLRLGERLVVRTELVETASGWQRWGEQYVHRMSNVLEMQEEIARQISEQLRLRLTCEQKRRLAKTHTESTKAYRLYLKGRYFWNKRDADGLKKALEYFRQAIEEDPAYALAFTGLSDCYGLLGSFDLLWPKEASARAAAAAMKALEIDNSLAEAHVSLARARMLYEWDFAGAEKEFERAVSLNPNYATAHHWYGMHLLRVGRFGEALLALRRAQELDPLSLTINSNLATLYYCMGQTERALEQCREVIEIDPTFGLTYGTLALAQEQSGMHDEAIAALRHLLHLSNGDHEAAAYLGHAYAISGREKEARKVLDKLTRSSRRRYVAPFHLALIHLGLNEKDRAFALLEKAYQERDDRLTYLKAYPVFDPLRSDARFKDLLRRVRLMP